MHYQHNDNPDDASPLMPGDKCGPDCPLFENPDPDTCAMYAANVERGAFLATECPNCHGDDPRPCAICATFGAHDGPCYHGDTGPDTHGALIRAYLEGGCTVEVARRYAAETLAEITPTPTQTPTVSGLALEAAGYGPQPLACSECGAIGWHTARCSASAKPVRPAAPEIENR